MGTERGSVTDSYLRLGIVIGGWYAGGVRSDGYEPPLTPNRICPMINFLAILLFIVLAPIHLLLWLTESQTQRIKRQRRQGWTLKRIADHHSISTSTVRRRLA